MTTTALPYQATATHASATATDGFADSFSLFALTVMSMFAIAIGFALVGLTAPRWLGFS